MSSPALAAQQLTESQKPTSPSPQRLESKITPRLRLNGYSPKPESRNPTEHLMFYVFNSVASFIYLFIIYTVFLTKIFYCSQKDLKHFLSLFLVLCFFFFFLFALLFSFQFPFHPVLKHGSDRSDTGSDRTECVGRGRVSQIGYGTEAHGRPLSEMPNLQRHGSDLLHLFALVRWRCRMRDLRWVGSQGV